MDLYFVASYYASGYTDIKCFGLFTLQQIDNKLYLKWKRAEEYKYLRDLLPYLHSDFFYFIDEGWPQNEYVRDTGFPFHKRYLNCVMNKEDLWNYTV